MMRPLLLLLLVFAHSAQAAPFTPGDSDADGVGNVFEDVFGNGDCDDDDTDGDATPD